MNTTVGDWEQPALPETMTMSEGVWPVVLIGDVREKLKELEDESVHMVCTSPPYHGLRAYLDDDHPDKPREIGLEPTVEGWVATLVEVFREVKRVMRRDATLWLNLGDSYACSPNGRKAKDIVNDDRTFRDKPFSTVNGALKPKDLVGQSWRLAFALQADGWWLRSAITLCKNNPMPESVQDRPTQATEMLFLLTRAERYFYDATAIAEPSSGLKGERFGSYPAETFRQDADRPRPLDTGVKNKRNWWVINSQPTPFAHFATFPEALVEPCILAGTSEAGVCSGCGAPWRRVVEREGGDCEASQRSKRTRGMQSTTSTLSLSGNGSKEWAERGTCFQQVGWQASCTCQLPTESATVLDIFAGSGTTLRVATRLGRKSIGIELNEAYVRDILSKRTAQGGLGL